MKSSRWYKPKFGFDIRINPEKPKRAKPSEPGTARCAVFGCTQAGEFKVPKTRRNLEDRHWLCREHVRERNARWNFFAGMSAEDIQHYSIDALTGHRPTWPLGKRSAKEKSGEKSFFGYQFEDGFTVFEDAAEPAAKPRARRLTKVQIDSLAVLNLEENASLHEIKARYKELVKRFHPDANGGDRSTEERLRQVIKAYGQLRAAGLA